MQLASGGNDNLLNIWDERRVATAPPVFSFDQHHAAVKALAWCPVSYTHLTLPTILLV